LGLTRLELARRSGLSRGTLRDLELGVHTPTRKTLQRFVAFCEREGVPIQSIEELRQIYAGAEDSLLRFIARLELRAGSPRELARRVGISPATLWEYRRGHFPLPLPLLRKMCTAAGEQASAADLRWEAAEQERLRIRGYPEALVQFWMLCARSSLSEKQVMGLGLSTSAARRMRYLELPAWSAVAAVCRKLCVSEQECQSLEALWRQGELQQAQSTRNDFGLRLRELRKRRGLGRREIADVFGIGGKKPARIIKNVEEDGFYSVQAYPAGLAALLAKDEAEREELLKCWRARRQQFHLRHRPETRIELRLYREQYGFTLAEMQSVLGYTSLEYQKIERGVSPLLDSAAQRIIEAIQARGKERVADHLRCRAEQEAERAAWQWPASVPEMISLLAGREGGIIPLARFLKSAGLRGLWAGRLRSMASGRDLPPWCILEKIGRVAGVRDLTQVYLDWGDRYRKQLRSAGRSPLGVEIRLLIGELSPTLREFSPRLGFNDSVLVRDLQRLDRDETVRWYHVERILDGVGLAPDDSRRLEIRGLWATTAERRKSVRRQKVHAASV
jgi:transcriptional regulator with XRE-family HTH domain